jgi:hypothetical protein
LRVYVTGKPGFFILAAAKKRIVMKTQFCLAALAIVLVVSLGVSSADIPRTINFQGRLSTAEGIPLNGLHDIKITIYPEPPTKPLFVEEHPGVAVSGGVFNILIGSRTVGGVPSSVFEKPETSIGITVGTDPEMTPTLPLSAVPYAYRAEMAQAFELPLSITAAKTSTLLTLNNTSSGNAILEARTKTPELQHAD